MAKKFKKADRQLIKGKDLNYNDDDNNLGLDADHSSDSPSLIARLNNDNDRISGNPDGENDVKDFDNDIINNSLDEK